jgi:hypothetical protein
MAIQTLKSVTEKLVRRLCVNYIAYMGQKEVSAEWLDGYYQARKDCDSFLKQLQMFEPKEEDMAESA